MSSGIRCDHCNCDEKLAKKAAWKYILMKQSSYDKVAEALDISTSTVGKLLREVLPTISPFLNKLVLRKKDKNALRARENFLKNVVKK